MSTGICERTESPPPVARDVAEPPSGAWGVTTPDYFGGDPLTLDVCASAELAQEALDRHTPNHWKPVSIRQIPAKFPGGDRCRVMWATMWPRDWTPRHALDLPENFDGADEEYFQMGDLETRAAALEATAETNRVTVITLGESFCWHVVIEFGLLFACQTRSRTRVADNAGVETLTLYRPIRLVRPTAAEIRQFAPPAEVGRLEEVCP